MRPFRVGLHLGTRGMNAITPVRRNGRTARAAPWPASKDDADVIRMCNAAVAATLRGVELCEGPEYEDDSPTDIEIRACWKEYRRLESIVFNMPAHTLEGMFAKAEMLSTWWKSGSPPDHCDVAVAIFDDIMRLNRRCVEPVAP